MREKIARLMKNPKFPFTPIGRRWLRHALLLVLLAGAAVVFTTVNVASSRKIGRLSTTPLYDDVSYFNVGSKFYMGMHPMRPLSNPGHLFSGRFTGQMAEFARSHTHAPVIVLLAIVGWVLFGFGYVKVYYMLALVVFAYLAFVALVCRRLPLPYLACVVLASLAIPFATMASLEFRPDQLWTVVIAGSSVWFLTKRRPFASPLPSVVFGLMMGVALLGKPTAFAMTFAACGGSWFLAACVALKAGKERFSRIALGFGITAAVVLATAGWYCIPHAGEIWDYFYVNVMGDQKEIWTFRGSLAERMLYYLRGLPLQSNLGNFFLPLMALYVGGAARDIVRPAAPEDRLRGMAFLWMLSCQLLVNGVFTTKSPYLGGGLYGFLIFGGLWNLSRLLRWCWDADKDRDKLRQLRRRATTGLAVVAGAWAAYRFPELCTVNKDRAKELAAINRAVVQDLLTESKSEPVNLVLTHQSPVVGEYIHMEFRRRRRPLEISNLATQSKFRAFKAAAETADFVLLQDPALPGSPRGHAFPSEQLLPQLLEHFHHAPDWRIAAEYPVAGGKRIYLFAHIGAKKEAQ